MEDELVIFKDLPDKSTALNAYNLNHNFDVYNKQIKAEASKIDTTLQEIQTFQKQTEETINTKTQEFEETVTTQSEKFSSEVTKQVQTLTDDITEKTNTLQENITQATTDLQKQITDSNTELTQQITDSKTSLESDITKTKEELYTEIAKQIASISSLSIHICEKGLPTENISETTIYLIKPENLPSNGSVEVSERSVANAKSVQSLPTVKPEVFDVYGNRVYRETYVTAKNISTVQNASVQAIAESIPDDEYYIACFWVKTGEDTHKWVAVGNTKIDLTQYSTTEEMNSAIKKAIEDLYNKIKDEFVDTTNDQTINGVKTFSSLPKVPFEQGKEDYANEEVASVGYVVESSTDLVNNVTNLVNAKVGLIKAKNEEDAVQKSIDDPNNAYYWTDEQPTYDVKPFNECSDEELAQYLQWHYAGKIDLAEHWSVGDTRVIHLNGIDSPNENVYTESWSEQDITIVITTMNHHDLAEPIGARDKAAVTLQTRECLNDLSRGVNENGCIFVNLNNNIDSTFSPWSKLPMRTWMNNQFYNTCFSDEWKALIKDTKHKRLTTYNQTTTEEVVDKFFLPSYPEIFGNTAYQYYIANVKPNSEEGTQWDWYKTSDNRVKKGNSNGAANTHACYWWMGSAASYYDSSYGYDWCRVDTSSAAFSGDGSHAHGLAPAFCL